MRIVLLLRMGYAVWRTRDIWVGVATHTALNGLDFAMNSAPTLAG